MLGVVVPVEFGLAFAMSRPFRRVRLPLEIAGAAVLARIAPQVTQVSDRSHVHNCSDVGYR